MNPQETLRRIIGYFPSGQTCGQSFFPFLLSIASLSSRLLFVLLPFAHSQIFASAAFTASGLITYEVKREESANPNAAPPSNIAAPTLSNFFAVTVRGCAWDIGVAPVNPGAVLRLEWRFDGTNLLFFGLPAGWSPDHPMVGASLASDPVPWDFTADGQYVWMAFASGCYFDRKPGSAMSLNRLDSKAGRRRYEVPARWTRSKTPPYLPLEVSYYRPNMTYLDDDGRIQTSSLPAPFQAGYVDTHFETVSTTNYFGLELPLEFTVTRFRPATHAKSTNDLIANAITRAWVTNISEPHEIPPAPSQMMVEDSRVSGPSGLYPVQNGVIPPTNNPTASAARIRGAEISCSARIAKSNYPPWLQRLLFRNRWLSVPLLAGGGILILVGSIALFLMKRHK